eukprot:gene12811-15034_t
MSSAQMAHDPYPRVLRDIFGQSRAGTYQWNVNGHYYFYGTDDFTLSDAHRDCNNRVYKNLQGQENDFIMSMYNSYYGSDSGFWFWMSGSDINSPGIYKYSSGPEKNMLQYDTFFDKSNMFTKWALGEPNLRADENGVHYDPTTNGWNNNVGSKLIRYICEFGGLTDPVFPSITSRGSSVATIGNILNWNLASTASTMSVTMVNSNTGSSMECTNINVTSTSSITCNLPPGTGQYKVTINNGLNSPKITYFQYQLPVVSIVYPMFKIGETVWISGENFGKDPSLISVAVSTTPVSCTEGLVGKLGWVESSKQADLLKRVCVTLDSSYVSQLLWTSVVQDGTENGPFKLLPANNTVIPYSSETIYKDGSTNLLYSIPDRSATLSYPSSQGGTLTEFSQSAPPDFPSIVTYNISTRGELLSIPLTSGGTSFSTNVLVFKGVNHSISNDFYLGMIFCNISAGYGLPAPFVVTIGSKSTPNNKQFIGYNPPVISTLSALTTAGGILTITGDELYQDTSLIQVMHNDQSATVTSFITPHTTLTANINPSYGSSSIVLLLAGRTSNTLQLTIPAPTIDSITNIGPGGGLVTVSGNNLYKDASLLSITIGSDACGSIAILTPHTQITCMAPFGSPNALQVNLLLATSIQDTSAYQFTYDTPTVLEISSALPNTSTLVTISGSNFANHPSLAVTIGIKPCLNPTFIDSSSLSCTFKGDAPSLKDEILPVTVTFLGFQAEASIFSYTPIVVPPCPGAEVDNECSGHGICDLGICTCDEGYGLLNCSIPIIPGKPPISDNETAYNPADLVNFNTSITHIRELNVDGSIVRSLAISTIKWAAPIFPADNQKILIGTFPDDTVVLHLTITIFKERSNITFASQVLDMPINSVKHMVNLTNWSFAQQLNSLEIIYSTVVDKNTLYHCNPVESTANLDSFNSYEMIAGGSIFQAKFANRIIVDGRVVLSRMNVLDPSDPLVTLHTPTSDKVLNVLTSINIPYFRVQSLIDPSFTALVMRNDKTSPSCSPENDTKWRLIVIITCSAVGGLAIIATSILLFKKRMQRLKFKKALKRLHFTQQLKANG